MHIPMEITTGYITVPVTVQGRAARFLLDTGADATVLTPALAEDLGLQTTGWHEGGVAGGHRIRVPLTEIERIEAGPRSASLRPVAIVDLSRNAGPCGEVDGILGSDFIRLFPVTVDYPGSTLVFESADSLEQRANAGVSVALHVVEETTPYLSVLLNESLQVDRAYKIDTGAGPTYVRMQDLEALGIDLSRLHAHEKPGVGGSYSAYSAMLESLSLGPGLSIENLAVEAYESEIGFLGSTCLSRFVVTLDYAGRRAIFGR